MELLAMEIYTKIKNYFLFTLEQGSLGLSLSEIITIIISFILAIIIRGIFAKIIVSKIKKIVKKTGNNVDDQLLMDARVFENETIALHL